MWGPKPTPSAAGLSYLGHYLKRRSGFWMKNHPEKKPQEFKKCFYPFNFRRMKDWLPPAGAGRGLGGPQRRAVSPVPRGPTRAPALLYTAPTGASSGCEPGSGYDDPCTDRDGRSDICRRGTWPPGETKDPGRRDPKPGRATPETTCGQAARWGQPVLPALATGRGAVDSRPARPSSNHSDSGPLLSPGAAGSTLRI